MFYFYSFFFLFDLYIRFFLYSLRLRHDIPDCELDGMINREMSELNFYQLNENRMRDNKKIGKYFHKVELKGFCCID